MSDILIRGVDEKAMKRLRARAKRHGRSLQSEARLALERAACAGSEEIAVLLDGWKRRFAGRRFSSGASLLRQDRLR